MAQGVIDEDLANGAASGEAQHRVPEGRIASDKGRGVGELMGGRWGEADDWGEGCGSEGRGKKHVGDCENGGEEILSDHHLGTGIGSISGKDVVLCAVCEAVKEEVYAEEE